MRKLLAESGASVLDRYNALYGGHLQRWLVAFEASDDGPMLAHGRVTASLLEKVGLLTREMLPATAGTTITQNFYATPDYYKFMQRAITILRRHPEALADWRKEFAPGEAKLIEHAAE